MLDKKRQQKLKNARTGQTSPLLGFTKKSSTLPRVVWVEESKNGIGFKIRPNYGNAPTTSQLLIYGQSSCKKTNKNNGFAQLRLRVFESQGGGGGGAPFYVMIPQPQIQNSNSRWDLCTYLKIPPTVWDMGTLLWAFWSKNSKYGHF